MKKFWFFLLTAAMLLSLAACAPKETPLTAENVAEYLTISADIKDCEVEKESLGYLGVPGNIYSGKAFVDFSISNPSAFKFRDVSLRCRLYTKFDWISATADDCACGWEFTEGNRQDREKDRGINYKTIDITLPADGYWSTTEDLELVDYSEGWIHFFMPPQNITYCGIEILSVSGSVIS